MNASSARWSSVALGEVVELINGDRGRNYPSAKDRVAEGVPFINAGHLVDGRVDRSLVDYIAEEHHQRLRSGHVYEGDVLLCIRGSLGRVALASSRDAPGAIASSLVILRSSERVLPRFLLAYLQAPLGASMIMASDNGSAQPNIGAGDVARFRMPLPPIAEQRSIVSVLKAFDDLIETNRRRIEILEEMARLIYREWFVHFRFPGHEDVEFVDSDLGPIPDGWKIHSVNDVAELVRGRSYRRADLVDEPDGVAFLNLKCIDRGGGFRKSGLKRYEGPFKKKQLAVPGDTVIAVTDMTQERNIVAQAGRVPSLPDSAGVISLDLVRVLPIGDTDADYLYAMFRYSKFANEVREHANGTNVLHLSPDRIREYCFVVAPLELQQQFRNAVRPMYDLVANLELQSETLEHARDLLLPRLVSGEVDLSNLQLDLEPVA